MRYPLYYGEFDSIRLKIEGRRTSIRLRNYVTFDYDTKDKRKIRYRYNKIEKFMGVIRKELKLKTRLFVRETKRGYHFILAFKKDYDLAANKRPMALRRKFIDDKDRIKIDNFRIDAMHYMPYLPGVLFDCKDGIYKDDRWIEID